MNLKQETSCPRCLYWADRVTKAEAEAAALRVDAERYKRMRAATFSHVDQRDVLAELSPNGWHMCDIHVRINGEWRKHEGDWLRKLFHARDLDSGLYIDSLNKQVAALDETKRVVDSALKAAIDAARKEPT